MSIELVELWFARAVPTPTTANQKVQAGCHLEEVAEMVEELESSDADMAIALLQLQALLHYVGNRLKKEPVDLRIKDRSNFLDAIADQAVTGTGLAVFHGMKPAEALQRVNASNWSKFVDGQPIFLEGGKIGKGPDYKKADLTGCY